MERRLAVPARRTEPPVTGARRRWLSAPSPSVRRMASRASARASGYRCAECGWTTAKWVGRCGECQAWGSVAEVGVPDDPHHGRDVGRRARPLRDRPGRRRARRRPAAPGSASSTGCSAAASCRGAVVLLAGEPGVGKSTLLLDVAARAARGGQTVLYVSGEESAAQVRLRAERIGALAASLLLAAETDLATVLGHVEEVQPDLLVVDSVQTIASAQVEGRPATSPRSARWRRSLIQAAKERGIAVLLVGHVTKDGSIAGPRVLEHLVDVVVQFEGDRHSRLRLVRAVKNRYGPTDEVGCFDLSDVGIVGLADPSGLFLSHRDASRCRAPASRSPSRAAGRWSPRCRRWSRRATLPDAAPGHVRPRRQPGGDGLAVLERRAGARSAAATSTSRPSAACGSPSRPPTSRSRSASPARSSTSRCRPHGRVRRGRAGRRGAAGAGYAAPAGRGGAAGVPRAPFTPRGVAGSGPSRTACAVVEVADVAGAVVAALDVPARARRLAV